MPTTDTVPQTLSERALAAYTSQEADREAAREAAKRAFETDCRATFLMTLAPFAPIDESLITFAWSTLVQGSATCYYNAEVGLTIYQAFDTCESPCGLMVEIDTRSARGMIRRSAETLEELGHAIVEATR